MTRPLTKALLEVEEKDVIVLSGVKTISPKHFDMPPLGIVICDSGSATVEFGNRQQGVGVGNILILLPYRTGRVVSHDADFSSTVIIISNSMFKNARQIAPQHMFTYLFDPLINVAPEIRDDIKALCILLKRISESDIQERKKDLMYLLKVFFDLLDSQSSRTVDTAAERLFFRFYDLLVQSYKESREVKYYADRLCISPKYFSAAIMRISGQKASRWISDHVCYIASMMLSSKKEWSVNKIAEELGFEDIASFSRYYKHGTGMSPLAYRRDFEAM